MDKIPPTSIRLSANLYNIIKERANDGKRSLTKQIEFDLENYYKILNITKSTEE